MRTLFIGAFVANALLTAVSLLVLPEEIAVHFGAKGMPNDWAPKGFNVVIFAVLELPLFILFLLIPRWVLRLSPRWISLPNKEYWLRGEGRPFVKERLESFMWEYGVALFSFLFCIGLLTIDANLANPVRLNERLFFSVFIAFMAFTAYWCVKLVRAFRLPGKA